MDTRLQLNLVGIPHVAISRIEYVLYEANGGNSELPVLYRRMVLLVERLVDLVLCEISSCKRDLEYWEALSTSSQLEINLLLWQNAIYRFGMDRIAGLFRNNNNPIPQVEADINNDKILKARELRRTMHANARKSILNRSNDKPKSKSSGNYLIYSPKRDGSALSDDVNSAAASEAASVGNIERNIFVLRFDIQQLACMLASIREAAESLKKIHNEIMITSQRSVTTRVQYQPSYLSSPLADELVAFACDNLGTCIRDLQDTMETYRINGSLENVTRLWDFSMSSILSNVLDRVWPSALIDRDGDDNDIDISINNNNNNNNNNHVNENAQKSNDWEHYIDTSVASSPTNRSDMRNINLESTNGEEAAAEKSHRLQQAIERQILQINHLKSLYESINGNVREYNRRNDYPLELADRSARRPSLVQRAWVRNTCYFVVGGLLGHKILKMHQTGELRQLMISWVETMARQAKNQIIIPLTNLSRYLSAQIQEDSALGVTREELRKSTQDLRLMLENYNTTYGGLELELKPTSPPLLAFGDNSKTARTDAHHQQTKTTINNNNANDQKMNMSVDSNTAGAKVETDKPIISGSTTNTQGFSGSESSSLLSYIADSHASVTDSSSKFIDKFINAEANNSSHKNDGTIGTAVDVGEREDAVVSSSTSQKSPPSPTSTRTTIPGKKDTAPEVDLDWTSDSTEKAMESLMKRYTDELNSPLKGMVFGSLVTAALIQVQRVKIMTEAAMLRMDQVLVSNQLTIAGTAAMPAFALLGAASFLLRKLFNRAPPSHGEKTLPLRLALTEVERSLQEVYGSENPLGTNQLATKNATSTNRLSAHTAGGGRHGDHMMNDDVHTDLASAISSHPVLYPPTPTSPRRIREIHSASKLCNDSVLDNNISPANNIPLESETKSEAKQQVGLSIDFDDNTRDEETAPHTPTNTNKKSANGDTFAYGENAQLIGRGGLCLHLLQLRNELMRAFMPRYQKDTEWIFGSIQSKNTHFGPSFDWLRFPLRILSRIYNGEVARFDDDREYASILLDLNKLEAPDSEVDGAHKIFIAYRMRQSYRCFNL